MKKDMNYIEIKSLLSSIDDPVMRLEFVMDLGARLSEIPGNVTCTEVKGCASKVEICTDKNKFYGTADSAIVRGIVAILIAMANDKVADLRAEFESLRLNLGAGRLNGVEEIIKVISH